MTVKVKWPKVLNYDDRTELPILRWINLGNGTLFRISAFFCRPGQPYPAWGLQISIERVGSWFFKFNSDMRAYSWKYISEKLNVPESDAKALADFINAQYDLDCEQQGEYDFDYLKKPEPYGLGGEKFEFPIEPEIIL